MNVQTSNINQSSNVDKTSQSKTVSNSDVTFTDELKELQEAQNKQTESDNKSAEKDSEAKDVVEDLNSVIEELNQSEDKAGLKLKNPLNNDDNNIEGLNLINNDYNIDNKDVLPQMSFNMNFEGNNQSFSSLMNNNSEKLAASAKDLAEEAAILSTMAENIAMANKADIENKTTLLHMNDGIKRVDSNTNIVQETIVEYDTVIVSEQDADFFANLVNNKEINYMDSDSQSVQKAFNVSKSLADLLAKSMEENKPVRIEFDNGISVIIKITRDGKLSADFLPSTQIAEAYLRENLPILKQRLSEQNLDYDELNQRERQSRDREENRKKGRENE